ncbi:MAG: putative sulfate/molybdate transporter [bacterium]|nr:putative sulfate/molybdate transporter [bacterium]
MRFDRHELAGSFGDIGTDVPLIVGMILAAGLHSASVFIVFGALQIIMGIVYGLPMPMQPLKAMAVLVISRQLPADVLLGGGLSIGAVMLALTLTGGLTWLSRVIPVCVVRGIQLGLGLALAQLALTNYIPAAGAAGYVLGACGVFLMIMLWGNRRVPPGLLLIALGVIYAVVAGLDVRAIHHGIGIRLPAVHVPSWSDIWTGFLMLALPQLPLSISNSVIATHQTIKDLFPTRQVSPRMIGLTFSLANLAAPWLGGIPVCHGCGGLAGHYAFGARTGGSVIIYGMAYVLLGLLFSGPLHEVLKVFPQPILGVVLLFESLALMRLIADQAHSPRALSIALLVGVVACAVPHGFIVGMALGVLIFYGVKRFGCA